MWILPDVYLERLESRRGAVWGNTEIVDQRELGGRRDACTAIRLWRQFLEQLVLKRAGQFVIDQSAEPDQSERRSVQGGHRARAQPVQEGIAGDRGCD